jgi:hypothetical protein
MAFKEGSDGRNIWPECKKRGIAAIGYRKFAKYGDLSKYNEDEFDEICRQVYASISVRASLKKLVYKMKKGDIIYVKDGPTIVGKGKIMRKYQYDQNILKIVNSWSHFVKVDWVNDFTPFKLVLGADLHTILELKDERLKAILKAESKTNKV